MLWTRWNPWAASTFRGLHQLQNQMSRLFERFGDDRFASQQSFPNLNVWEDKDALVVEAELPGLTLADLEIFVTGQNQLTIKGERKHQWPEDARPHRQERGHGSFVRTLTLPFPVDDTKVEARLDNGILTVHLPKHEAAKPRKIAVKA